MRSNYDARMNFQNARQIAMDQGYGVDQAICTQSFIRSEVAMSTATANYSLPILANQQSQNGTTVRALNVPLNLQDVFIVNELFVGWTVASATDVNGKLYTYPNATAATSATIAKALNTLYNGKLSIQMNNRNILPNWDLNRHFCVNQTQQNANFNTASPTSPAQFTIDQENLSVDGFCPVEPNWIFNGAGNIQASIILPSAISDIPTNGAIVAIFRGILLQNVSTVK
jgi:hypothetical protein